MGFTNDNSQPAVSNHDDDSQDGVQTRRKVSWYRGVMFQATIVGLAAFAAPGLWNAMQSTGAGGQQTPYLVMAGNSILYSMMVLSCITGSIITNRVGVKAAFVFGTSGYALYSAALYCNNRYGTTWFIYFGSAACGITAGLFWVAEATIMLLYPEENRRGRYLAYWLAYRNGGSILGGIINLAFNYKGVSLGKLDWRTFIVFVVIQCLGPAVAMLLSNPHQVQRKDRSKVQTIERISTRQELREFGKMILTKDILLTLPLFFFATYELAYIGSYLSLYFSVRARALASLVSAIAQIIANMIFGSFLDWTRLSLNTRAKWSYIFMMGLSGATWVWGTVVQNDYGKHKPALDWNDSGFGRGWALYILWQAVFALKYNYCFWMLGFMSKNSKEVVRYSSLVRGIEAAGSAVASGISSTKAPLIAALGVNFGLWGIAVIPAWFVIKDLGLNQANTVPAAHETTNVHDKQDSDVETGKI